MMLHTENLSWVSLQDREKQDNEKNQLTAKESRYHARMWPSDRLGTDADTLSSCVYLVNKGPLGDRHVLVFVGVCRAAYQPSVNVYCVCQFHVFRG